MKRIIIIVSLSIIFFSSQLMANFYADISTVYLDAGAASTQYGFGVGLGMDLSPDINLLYKGNMSFSDKESTVSGAKYEIDYNHNASHLGIEYTPPLEFLRQFRLKWSTSLLAGVSSTSVDVKGLGNNESSQDFGLSLMAMTGIKYEWKQNIIPFGEIGWHNPIYQNDFKDFNIAGFIINIGVRFALNDINELGQNY